MSVAYWGDDAELLEVPVATQLQLVVAQLKQLMLLQPTEHSTLKIQSLPLQLETFQLATEFAAGLAPELKSAAEHS